VPEGRRLILALGEAAAQRPFRLGWSRWRRAQHAVAARCPAARRTLPQAAQPPARAASPPAIAAGVAVTDAEWCRVPPLLPLQPPTTGRLGRAIPQEAGPWETADPRARRWWATGLWPPIRAALSKGESKVSL
jgi:hypothetical protein